MIRLMVLSSLIATLYGCSTNTGKTLGDLQYTPGAQNAIVLEQANHQQVREEYQELLTLFKDEQIKEQIERRIAEVYMIEGDKKQPEQQRNHYYLEAIKGYHAILTKYPDSPDNAAVLYQLARAYELDGHQDKAKDVLLQLTSRHPGYKNKAEAHFRLGDIYFSQQRYRKAQAHYLTVTASSGSKLNTYAHYMLGWTYYKQLNFNASLNAFARVLNDLLDDNPDAIASSLVGDTVHAISLGLAKHGGASAIETIAALQGKPYLWKIYDNLGNYYLKKERYEDSAATFRHYVQRNNFAIQAPELHKKLIDTYSKGGFAKQALKEKAVYVDYYGLSSRYATVNGQLTDNVKQTLKLYYDELASHYHSKAQSLIALYDKNRQQKNQKYTAKQLATLQTDAIAAFEQATRFYQQYISTFANDSRVPQMTFLKAEAHFSAKQYSMAIDEFERVAYHQTHFADQQYRTRAGYAAIVAYQKQIKRSEADTQQHLQWRARAVESMLLFANVFSQDPRSASVMTHAAEYLLGLQQYERAAEVSLKLIKSRPALDKDLKRTAYGVSAHAYYQLSQYAQAQEYYMLQRSLISVQSAHYQQVSERLASAIYKHSETLVAQDKKLQAIDSFLNIKRLTPASTLRVASQYNAATLLMGMQHWDRAVEQLQQLVNDYPEHKLAPEFPRKLALAYEKQESWQSAGDTYLALSKTDKDMQVRRNSLFLAAEMYEKNRDTATAITLFKQYANTYQQPFSVTMEARYRLASLYETSGATKKKHYWLSAIIAADNTAGNERTDRSRWLAAWANVEFGHYFFTQFSQQKLTASLKKSLPEKNAALKKAVARFEQAADYGILEFVTLSSYKIAAMYQKLASALRNAPTPKGLSDEEKTLYSTFLEEQAMPLDQLAMDLYMTNLQRAWSGEFDQWIEKSFTAMRQLSPARFNKEELHASYGDEIR